MAPKVDSSAGDHSDSDSVEHSRRELLYGNPWPVVQGDLAKRQPAKHHGQRLAARVSGLAGDDRQQHRQSGEFGDGALEQSNHGGSQKGRTQIDQQPWKTLAHGKSRTGESPFVFSGAGHADKIGAVFLLEFRHELVQLQDADRHLAHAHHGQAGQLASFHDLDDLPAGGECGYSDGQPLDECPQPGFGVGQSGLEQRNRPDQPVVSVHHEQIEDAPPGVSGSHSFEGVADGGRGAKDGDPGISEPAGAGRGIVHQPAQFRGVHGGHMPEYRLPLGRRQSAQQRHRLRGRQSGQQSAGNGGFCLGEDVECDGCRQPAERLAADPGGNPGKDFGCFLARNGLEVVGRLAWAPLEEIVGEKLFDFRVSACHGSPFVSYASLREQR